MSYRITIAERDAMLLACWRDARFIFPEIPEGSTKHHAIEVLGIIDDPTFRRPGCNKPFVDIVAYWPALQKFTVTSMTRAAPEPMDYPVRVRCWQPLPPVF